MTIEEINERKNAIVGELDNDDADLDALESEMRSLNAEIEARKAEEAQKAEIRSAIANGSVGEVVVEEEVVGETTMSIPEEGEYELYIYTGTGSVLMGEFEVE